MTAAACTLEPVDSLGSAATAAVRRIYEQGFPSRLRAGFATLARQRQAGEMSLALVRDGQPRGFAVLRPLGETGWVFLRYFVVDERLRGQGLGGIMWDELAALLRADGYTLLVFDVEDPAEPGCGAVQARIRSRRIGFYQRHGAGLLPVHGYRTPHGSGWAPMLLLAAPLDAGGPAAAAARARDVVSAVYQHRWQLGAGHPQVRAVRITTPGQTSAAERASTPQKGRAVTVDYEIQESVAWIRLNRPHRLNAVVPELTAGLTAAVDRADQEGARVAVLPAGAGRSAPGTT
jgi:GNAT superfamily N-acetyltransferase